MCGSSAYVSQSAWIQSGTIEENILFGSPMDKAKYKNVLHACSLKKDLELFSHGDQTIIGGEDNKPIDVYMNWTIHSIFTCLKIPSNNHKQLASRLLYGDQFLSSPYSLFYQFCLELGKTANAGIWHCFDGGNPFF